MCMRTWHLPDDQPLTFVIAKYASVDSQRHTARNMMVQRTRQSTTSSCFSVRVQAVRLEFPDFFGAAARRPVLFIENAAASVSCCGLQAHRRRKSDFRFLCRLRG